jgi:calcineurin-like phosphoesterase family protein/NACHT domain-containing protein
MSTILHLSDLHFGTVADAHNWYNQLAEDLKRELNCDKLDAIILSGDIANVSEDTEYTAAKTFLDNVCNEFEVEADKVVIVPGNHDLSWLEARKAYRVVPRKERLWLWAKNAYYVVRRKPRIERINVAYVIRENGRIRVRDEELYKRRFLYFSTFYENYTGRPYPTEYGSQFSLQHFPNLGLLVLGLNSAWELDHHYKSRISINTTAISNALTAIRTRPAWNSTLKLAIWHHPLNSPFEDRLKDHGFIEQLAKAGFRFGLHGHIHKAEKGLYRYDSSDVGRQLAIIGAGTFGAPTKELTPGYPWQYNLLRIEGNTVRVETRRREELNGAWKPDARWTRRQGELPTPFYDIEIEKISEAVAEGSTSAFTELEKDDALISYRDKLLNETRDMDYRGLTRKNDPQSIATLPFDDVYIPQRLVPHDSWAEAHARQEQVLQRILAGSPTIEDAVKLEEEYARLASDRWKPAIKLQPGETSISAFFERVRHGVVLGEPGVGKSSLARYITRTIARGMKTTSVGSGWSNGLIPITVRVADLADELSRQPEQTLAEFISLSMMKIGGDVLREAVSDAIVQGSAIIIIEGIDEVPEYGDRVQVVKTVDKCIREFAANRFVITSRPSGYIPLAGAIAHFKLSKFSYEEIRRYIMAWHYALERQRNEDFPDLGRAQQKASDSYAEIGKNQRLVEFSTNPLLLTLIILLQQQGIRLPTRRVQLYKLVVDVLMDIWKYWRAEGNVSGKSKNGELSTIQLIQVWACIAEWAHRTRPNGVLHRAVLMRNISNIVEKKGLPAESSGDSIQAYLDAASKRAGILEERAPDLFAFWHPTFEEYLAGIELVTPASSGLFRLLPLRNDPRWREVILLAVAYVGTIEHDEETATAIVEAISSQTPDPVWEPLVSTYLRLAVACISDSPGIERNTVESALLRLAETVQRLPYGPLIQAFVNAIRSLPDLALSPEAITAISSLARHPNEFVRTEVARLFANVAETNPAARDWCLALFDDPYYEVKYHAALGLVKAGDHRYEVWRMLMSFGVMLDINPELREYLSQGSDEAADALRTCLDSPYQNIQFLAARFLVQMNRVDEKVVDALIRSLSIEEVSDLETCERLLANLNLSQDWVLSRIYDHLTDESHNVRFGVANFLYKGQRREAQVLDAITSCLASEDLNVRWQAADLLWEHGLHSENIREAAASCLESESISLRGAVANTLRKMNHAADRVVISELFCLTQSDPIDAAKRLLRDGKEREKVIKALYDHLTDDDHLVRVHAANLLVAQGEVGRPVLEALKSCLRSDHHPARRYAWWTLNELGMLEGVLEALVRKLATEGPFWRPQAKDSITTFIDRSKLSKVEVESTMLPLLESDDAAIRSTVAELLLDWGIATEQSIKVLVALLTADIQENMEVFRKLLNEKRLELNDGARLLALVEARDGNGPIKRNARALLYQWLWRQQAAKNISP